MNAKSGRSVCASRTAHDPGRKPGNLTINKTGSGHTLKVSSTGLTSATAIPSR